MASCGRWVARGHCQRPHKGHWPPLLTSVVLAFSGSTLDACLKVFLNLDWTDLGVSRNLWMSNFQNTKKIGNPMVGSKVMGSRSMLMCFARFFEYLHCFNSYFDPWIVVGKGIWQSSQWHWSQSILTVKSKLMFLVPLGVSVKSNLVKLDKNLRVAWVWCKSMKNVVSGRL